MCNDDLFEILVRPLKQFLGAKKMFNDHVRSNTNIVSERGLIRLAELFAAMASNDIGYQHLIRTPAAAKYVRSNRLFSVHHERPLSLLAEHQLR